MRYQTHKVIKNISDKLLPVSSNPRAEAETILAKTTGATRQDLRVREFLELDRFSITKLDKIISQRTGGKPLELLLGHTEFYGNTIGLERHVLIPRPETEELTDFAANHIKGHAGAPVVLEIGTGSGCITTSLIQVMLKLRKPFEFIGVEPYGPAVDQTLANIKSINRITLEHSCGYYKSESPLANIAILPQALGQVPYGYLKNVNVLVANPPYLTSRELTELPDSVRLFEPKIALDGGKDGLDVYKAIVELISKLPLPPRLFLEISPTIRPGTVGLFTPYYPSLIVKNDLFGRERFLLG